MIGKIILHYKILEKLGEGGMGIVYKAHDTKLDRLVALKFLPPHITVNKEDRERFLQEARAASAVIHPNVSVIHDMAEYQDQQFIVMEYVEGQTLRQMVPISNFQQAIGYAILNEEPHPIQKYLPEASSELLHILDRALEKDPEDRYQSVHDMLIDLRRVHKQTSRVVRPAAAPLPVHRKAGNYFQASAIKKGPDLSRWHHSHHHSNWSVPVVSSFRIKTSSSRDEVQPIDHQR